MSQQNPWGQQPGLPNPYGAGGGIAGQPPPWQRPRPQKKQPSVLLWVLAILGGGTLLFVLVCCGLVATMFSAPGASAAAQQPFNLASVPVPPLPEPGSRRMFDPQVVVSETTILNQTGGIYTPAG